VDTNFRTEIFKLCKKLQKDETSRKIGELIHEMSRVEETEVGQKITNSRNDFAYMAKNSNTEFHGFVFLDDNIGKIKMPHFFSPEHLSPEERNLFERGHKTLMRLIELCLSDIASKSNTVAAAMNPYFMYAELNLTEDTEPLLSDEELQPAVLAFKNGTVYSVLMKADFTRLFSRLDVNSMRKLVSVLETSINKSLGEDTTDDLRDFSMKLHSKLEKIEDIMFAFMILMFALMFSLKLACRLMYRAICGIDLFVLNNENIINIEKRSSTIISEFYKVLAQDIQHDFSRSEMGSILLIDCDLPSETHVHEFGMLVQQTINFAGEFGASAKYSFITVNEELIHIHRLVTEVLRIGLPNIRCAV